MPKASRTVITLSCLDDRYFRDLGDSMLYNIDFVVYNIETKEEIGQSYNGSGWEKSTTCDVYLDEGTYAVYVSLFYLLQ